MTERVVETGVRPRADARASALDLDQLARLALAAGVALAVYVLWRGAVLRPFSDVLDWVARDEQFRVHGGLAHYLLAPHNMHRLVWTLALLDVDRRLFAGSGWPLIISGALGLALAAWLLARAAYRAAPPGLETAYAAAAALLALAPPNVLTAALPIFTEYAHTLAFGMLALTLAEARETAPSGWRALGVLACVVASAFGNAVGLALLPALVYGALVRRAWRWLGILAPFSLAFAVAYLFDPQGSGAGHTLAGLVERPADAIALMLSVLGLPWSRAAAGPGMVIGAGVLVLAIAALCTRPAEPGGRLARTMIVFSLATVAMAGLGRVDQGAQAPVRYALFMTPAHVGLLIAAAPVVSRYWRARRSVMEGLILCVLVIQLIQAGLMSVLAVRASDNIRNLIAAFEAGERTPMMTTLIHPDLDHAADVFRRMRSEHLFQHEIHLAAGEPMRSP